ncbi:MAG: leucyl aminopeptidase [Proteobacteria bacterium]|nr:leucyl aminopeptidase [Pseudomonadota bacterium]NOG61435.1 leucyl aminopeptidase [Pseudomonadota bacterium]
MDFNIKSGNPEKQRTACVIVAVFESRRLSPAAKAIDDVSDKHLSNLIRRGDMEGNKGQYLLLHNVPGMIADRVLLIGCGKEREIDDLTYRKIIANSIRALNTTGSLECVNYLTELSIKGRDHSWKIRQAVQIAEHSLYQFDELKSKKKKDRRPLRKITFTVPTRKELPQGEAAMNEGRAIANGIKLTRDLANRPSNICTPAYLAKQAQDLAKKNRSLTVTVLEEADMKKLGMGSLLSVSQGSVEPAKLITLEYKGSKKSQKPIVLVGKGVTFDTGGISLKPGQAMDEMKYDMCGAASVFGTIAAVVELGLPVNVVGVIPAVENMPSGTATNPGDIFTSMSGKTIEVLNTDAEGRLILCDAITYSERFNPEVVIDIATLTGACVIALGKHATGLLSNHNPLARDLLSAGEESGDRAWQLPLWDEYQEQLNSPFADMANIGGREAGTVTAACFLSRFAEKYHWAHLDIAGTAWISGANKGATGRPVSLLMQYIFNQTK